MTATYHQWLQQVVRPYADPGRTFRDVDYLLTQFPSLKPRTDNFTRIHTTPPQLMICLSGTLPVIYRGSPFNIPIELWLPIAYPIHPPLVYVVPTSSMVLRPSTHVDPSGRVLHNYLSYWHTTLTANLWDLLRLLQSIFAQEMPVFSNQSSTTTVSSSASNPSTASATTAAAKKNIETELLELRTLLRSKVSARMKSLEQQLAVDSDKILAENTLLNKGETALKLGLDKLIEELRALESRLEDIRSKRRALTLQITKLRDLGEVDIDTLVVPLGPLARQLILLTTDDHVYNDCIYILSKALFDRRSSVPLGDYLRKVRELARHHFLTKALIAKIRRDFPVVS